jgi:hypothetical protein
MCPNESLQNHHIRTGKYAELNIGRHNRYPTLGFKNHGLLGRNSEVSATFAQLPRIFPGCIEVCITVALFIRLIPIKELFKEL